MPQLTDAQTLSYVYSTSSPDFGYVEFESNCWARFIILQNNQFPISTVFQRSMSVPWVAACQPMIRVLLSRAREIMLQSLTVVNTLAGHQENNNALRNYPNSICVQSLQSGRSLDLSQIRSRKHRCLVQWHCNSGHYPLDRKACTRNTVAYRFLAFSTRNTTRKISLFVFSLIVGSPDIQSLVSKYFSEPVSPPYISYTSAHQSSHTFCRFRCRNSVPHCFPSWSNRFEFLVFYKHMRIYIC